MVFHVFGEEHLLAGVTDINGFLLYPTKKIWCRTHFPVAMGCLRVFESVLMCFGWKNGWENMFGKKRGLTVFADFFFPDLKYHFSYFLPKCSC